MSATDMENITSWFIDNQQPDGAISVRTHILDDSKHAHIVRFLSKSIPYCYISKKDLEARVNETGLSASEILKNKLPDPGSVMAGDFGEILTLFYLGSERNEAIEKLMKWQYKQDRTKAAPHSDVVILHREFKDRASKNDFVICAEAKVKSTQSKFSPIEKSIEGYCSDKTGRLARTLVWLKEKAIDEESPESIAYIKRFTDDLLDIEFKKNYRAVAVIDRNFLDQELQKSLALPEQNEEFEVIVIGIPNLKQLYEQIFFRAVSEVSFD
ncbi:Hachiman antiphage defense system protein HamA [Legionella tunisiensis]|uniref:Hachiman antiphage defense system protein HamA n=1 Tax=Legionella tunisiensis TaxID=1034944 RepID=UPI00037609F8|nr:Hachiman antiphage defense system protein HamA [Legionella tunisiensis]